MRKKLIGGLFCVWVAFCAMESLHAQGTAFTYQGQLNNGGTPASGSYDLTFALYGSTNAAAAIVAGPITNSAVAVTNGLFTSLLDFGAGIFTGTNYWLGIAVRTNGTTIYTTLMPRQPLTPVPYAIFANSASNLLGSLPSTQLTGALPSAQISGTYVGAVNFSNSANTFIGTFSGDGSSLSNLNASRLASGTVADARLSANVALLNANQSFTGVNTFTNFGNSFRGSFFGNGLVGWVPTNGTSVQAVIDTGYVLTSSSLVTVTLPASPNVGDIVRISGAGAGGWKIAQNANQSIMGNFLSYSNSYWPVVQSADNVRSIASSADGSKLVAGTDSSGIISSANSGASWTSGITVPASGRDTAASADGTKLFAVVNGGGIFASTNYGSSWQSIGPGTASWYAIASSSDGTKLAAAIYGGGIYTSVNSGTNWSLSGAPSANWTAIASSSDGTRLIAAASGGYVYVYSAGSWAAKVGIGSWAAVASSADGSKLAAANGSGYIYTSSDSGASWPQSGAPSATWGCLASSSDGLKLAAGVNGGRIYTSANAGATWTKQSGSPSQNWVSIASSADGTVLAAVAHSMGSSGGGIYMSSAGPQKTTATGTSGSITGGQGTAVELQYIGNSQFMPVSSSGTIWAN